MAYSETTGLLEINRNRQGRSFSARDVGTSPDLLERLLGRHSQGLCFWPTRRTGG